MKKKWLIVLTALLMALTMCFGFAACGDDPQGENPGGENPGGENPGGENPGGTTQKTDSEIAKAAISTIKVMYSSSAVETAQAFDVLGQTKVDDKLYPVVWTATTAMADVNISDYVKIGTMNESTKLVTIGISRATVDLEYTLKASVTVGSATESAEFAHKIPKKSSEDSVTASLDFSDLANRAKIDTENNEQVWKQNGVTLTNTVNVADYSNPIRLYKNTPVSIEMENARIIHIDFHSAQGYSDSPYPDYLKQSLEASDLPIKGEITVSDDGLKISVDFETPLEVVTFRATAGQCRLTSIDVEAIERDPNEHVHNWTYEHVANTWTHTATCTAEGCDIKTKTENCTPKLNVCACGYTYSAKEIVDALFALDTGKSLPGTYSLTGVITKVTEVDTGTYKNCTFDMTVEGQTVTVYRAKGSHYSEVEVGGTATVNGELLDYNGTKEFTQGASVVAFTPGVDERTPQEKVEAALQALADTFTVTKTGETDLPASTVRDVTFAWATEDKTYTIANNKINVTALPTADVTITATVTATCGSEAVTNNTKTVTITIKAEGSQPEIFYGTLEKPLTVAEAIALAGTIDGNDYLGGENDPIQVIVKGIVIATGTFTSYNNWQNAYIADTADASSGDNTKAAQVYRLAADGTFLKADGDLVIGATITIQGWLQAYNGKAEICHNKATNTDCKAVAYSKENVTPPTPSDADATLSFAALANRTEVSTEKQVWKQNGITFTNEKGASTSDINEKYYGPIRLYKSSSVKIEYTSAMKAIIFHCNTADYANTLKSSLTGTGFTVTVDGVDVTVTLDTPSTTFEFTASAGQIRIDSLEVYTKVPAGKTDAEKVADVKAALKLSKTQLTAVGEEVELPATQGEATLTWSISGTSDLVKIDGGKLTVLKLPAEDTVVTLIASITVGGASDTADVKITVKAEGTEPQPSGTLELTDATLFPNLDGTDYATYNGTHTVGKYTVTTTSVLGNTQDGYTDTYFLQFRASEGELKVTGSFTKIVIKFVSTYDAENTGNKLTVTAGSTTLTPVVKSSEKTGVSNSKGFEYSIHTVEYTVTVAGEQTITIKKDTAYAAYVSSITLEEGAAKPLTDAEKVANVKAALKLSKTELLTVGEEVELPATQDEATITWSISGTSDFVKIDGGKLTVLKLPAEDTVVTLIASITVGGASDTADVKITVKAEGTKTFVPMEKPKAGSDYYMGMKAYDGKYHYLTGTMSGYYMATTTDIAQAKKVTLAGNDTAGWTMVLDGKYIEIELSGSHVNAVYKTSQTSGRVWKWDSQYNIFTMEFNGGKYFLGTNGSYTTVGGGDYSKYVATNYLAVLGTWGAPEVTDQDKVDEALAAVETEYDVAVTGDYALPTPTVEGVTFAWNVTEGEYQLTNGNSLSIQTLPTEGTKVVKLTLTATCGTEGTGTKEITVTVHPAGWTKHIHNYQYVYTSGLKHTRTCTAPGCDEEGPVEEACTPELNVCPFCKHVATVEEVCDAVWAFPAGNTAKYLPGTYTFSGLVSNRTPTYSGNKWTFQFHVFLSDGTYNPDQNTRYKLFVNVATVADGLNITELLEGDKVTLTGSIGYDKWGTSQWWRGFMTTDAKITAYTKMTDEEKATDVMKKLDDRFNEIPAEQKVFKKVQSSALQLPMPTSNTGFYYYEAGTSAWTIIEGDQYCSISDGYSGAGTTAFLNIKAVPDVETKIKLKLTVTFGTVVKEKEYEVTLAVMTDQEMADEAASTTKAPQTRFFTVGETVELSAKHDKYPKAALSWTIKETTEYAKIEQSVLTILKLPEDADATLTLVVTANVNGKTSSNELPVTLKMRDKFTPITEPVYGYYHLSMEYYYDGTENYVASLTLKNSGKNTQYIETNKDAEKALVLALVPVPGETNKFFIKATGGPNDSLNYLYVNTISGTKVIATTTSLNTTNTPLATWEWDAEKHIFFVTIGEEKYVMGNTSTSQLKVSTLTYAEGSSSFSFARLGTYEGHEEKLTAPAQATSIKLFDATGVEIQSGATIRVKAEEDWGVVLYYTVAPENPLSAKLTLTSEDTNKVFASFGSTALGFDIYARSGAQEGDKVKLTITVLETTVTAELTVEIVAADTIKDVKGEKVADPMTIEELKAYVTALDNSVKGAYAKAGHNRNFYVKGKLTVEGTSGTRRTCYLGDNKEISLGSLSASSLKDAANEMGLQLADFNGIEVIVSGDFGFRTLSDGSTQFAARTANIHQANFSADQKLAFAQAALTVNFSAFKAVDATLDLTAAAENAFGVSVAWAFTAPESWQTYVSLTDGTLKIVKLPDDATTFTLKATLTLEGGTDVTKEFAFFLVPAADLEFDMSKNTGNNTSAQSASAVRSFLGTACGNNAEFTDVTTATQVFRSNSSGGPIQTPGCMKLGASGKDAELVLKFGKNVTKVIIVWASWSADEGKLTVNEIGKNEFQASFGVETFTLTEASDTLTIKSTGRVIITSISVYFEEDAPAAPEAVAAILPGKEY